MLAEWARNGGIDMAQGTVDVEGLNGVYKHRLRDQLVHRCGDSWMEYLGTLFFLDTIYLRTHAGQLPAWTHGSSRMAAVLARMHTDCALRGETDGQTAERTRSWEVFLRST